MDALSVSAASGIRARMESLEMLANNIANQATSGYKKDRELYGLYRSAESLAASAGYAPAEPPVSPVIERHWTDFSQGALEFTGNSLDVALAGGGFFVVQGPGGPLFTRNGNFRLSAGGTVVTSDGYPVLDGSGSPISLSPSASIEISQEGEVKQDGLTVAQLGVADFADRSALRKHGGTYFAAAGGNPATPAERVEVRQGYVESANLTPAEAAVELVNVMRQFEMLQKAARLGSDMNQKAIEEVARVRA